MFMVPLFTIAKSWNPSQISFDEHITKCGKAIKWTTIMTEKNGLHSTHKAHSKLKEDRFKRLCII